VNRLVILFLSAFMMVGCSSILLDDDEYAGLDEHGEFDEKIVEPKITQKREQIKFSEEEKAVLETISNKYGKCAAYYKYAILVATTTDETPFENIDEVGQKQSLSIKYALGLAIQIFGEKQGRPLVIENYMNEYRNNILIRAPKKLESLKNRRKKECFLALSQPEAFALSHLSNSTGDEKLKLRLSDIFKRIETNSL